MAEKLTPVQRKNLRELLEIENTGTTGEAFWIPQGRGEHSSAASLASKGMLTRDWQKPHPYSLTEAGREVARNESQDQTK